MFPKSGKKVYSSASGRRVGSPEASSCLPGCFRPKPVCGRSRVGGRCGAGPLAPHHAAHRPSEADLGQGLDAQGFAWGPWCEVGSTFPHLWVSWCWTENPVLTPDPALVSPPYCGGWVPALELTWAPVLPTVSSLPEPCSLDLGHCLCVDSISLYLPFPSPLLPARQPWPGCAPGCLWEEAVAVRPVSGGRRPEGACMPLGNAHRAERRRAWKHG